jgi:hypothetical protein
MYFFVQETIFKNPNYEFGQFKFQIRVNKLHKIILPRSIRGQIFWQFKFQIRLNKLHKNYIA